MRLLTPVLLPLRALNEGEGSLGLPAALTAASASPSWPEVLRVFGVLLGLLGLLLVALHLARRFWVRPSPTSPLIQILATRYLAARQALLVVAVGQERFLLASSQDRVDFLTPLAISRPETPASPESAEGGT